LALIPLVAAGFVEVQATGDCPSAIAIATAIERLVTRTPREPDRLIVIRGESLRIELRDPHGALLHDRVLATDALCAELASATAIMVATWESELHPEVQVRLPRPPRPLFWEVGAAFTAFFTGSTSGSVFAPGALAFAAFGPKPSGFFGRIAALASGYRDEPLGAGQASFLRAALAAGPQYRFAPRRFLIDFHAEFLAALVALRGSGFAVSTSTLDFDPGLGLGARFAVTVRHRLAFFADLSLAGWVRKQNFQVVGLDQTVSAQGTLPQLDILLSVGLSAGLHNNR
jgi:hypothetical protein